jgi:hypothetical protein
VTTRQLINRRYLTLWLGGVALVLIDGTIQRFLLSGARARAFDVLSLLVTLALVLNLLRTPCASCGKPIGWRALWLTPEKAGSDSFHCPHCDVSIDREVAHPVI